MRVRAPLRYLPTPVQVPGLEMRAPGYIPMATMMGAYGLEGLGQTDTTGEILDLGTPIVAGFDLSAIDFGLGPTDFPGTVTLPTLPSLSPAATQSLADQIAASGAGGGGLPTDLNVYTPIQGGGYVNTQTGQVVSSLPSGASSSSLAQIIQASSLAAQNALKLYQSTEQPYVIPGTNLVYNPATRQLGSALGYNASALTPAFLGSILPIGLALIGLVIVMNMMGGRR